MYVYSGAYKYVTPVEILKDSRLHIIVIVVIEIYVAQSSWSNSLRIGRKALVCVLLVKRMAIEMHGTWEQAKKENQLRPWQGQEGPWKD